MRLPKLLMSLLFVLPVSVMAGPHDVHHAAPVHRVQQTCPASLGPAEQIACLQTENAVLKTQIEHRDLVKKLDNPDGKVTDRQIASLPVVMSTFAVNGKSQAVLSWAGQDGGVLTVTPGQSLPQGWTVAEIDQGRVVIQRGKERHVLFLTGGAPAVTAQASGEKPNLALNPALPPSSGQPTQVPPFPMGQFNPAQPR